MCGRMYLEGCIDVECACIELVEWARGLGGRMGGFGRWMGLMVQLQCINCTVFSIL